MRGALILGVLLFGLALAQKPAVRFALPPLVEAGPGDYATLFFTLEGAGDGVLRLILPEGWDALPLPARITLNPPRTPVVVTVRVPEGARAGTAYPVTLEFCPEGGGCLRARGRVTVLHRPGILLHVEPETEGTLGEPARIRVTVTNRGNLPDRIRLVARANTGLAAIEPGELALAPGATGYATLEVSLRPDQSVSPGYRMATWVYAYSRYPGVEARARTLTRWLPRGGFLGRTEDPTLQYRIGGSVGLGAGVREGRIGDWNFDYGFAPGIRGALSDFVTVEARTNPIEHSEESIWPEPPRYFEARLTGEGWNTAITVERTRAAFSLGLEPGDWRFELGGNGRYDLSELNLSGGIASARRDLNLQLAGQLRIKNGARDERLMLRHVRPLGAGWALRLGGQYTGKLGEDGSYVGILAANPELVWRGRSYNFVAGMSLAPQIGFYAVSVSGGMRHFYPFGIRGSASYQTDPAGDRYRVFATAVAVPAPGSVFKLDAGVLREPGQFPQLQLVPGFNWLTALGGGSRLQFGLGYRFNYLPATGEAGHALRTSLGLSGLRYGLSLRMLYPFGDPYPTGELRFSLQPTPADSIELGYLRNSERIQYRARWDRRWGAGVRSFVGFLRSEEPTPVDRIRAGVIVERIAGSPLGMSFGYTLRDPDGLGEGSQSLEHRFRLALVFGLEGRFPTPEGVVEAFGGRREGVVFGRVFVDENQNGLHDAGEPGLAGVGVVLGRDRATSDEKGFYRLRARPGAYRPRLVNLPAELDLYRELAVTVRQGEERELDLPLAPTAQVAVWVFHDANRNGVPDPDERGIPYAGVRVEGPGGTRTVRTDAEGRVLVGGLLPGRNRFSPDPAALPARFRATGEPVELELEPGRREEVIALGAAPPPKKVATTFRPGKLAVFAHLPKPTAVPGAELEVRALVTDAAERVWAELPDGTRVVLDKTRENRYEGRIRLSRKLAPGPLSIRVVAERGGDRAETTAFATLVRGLPYRIEPRRATVGTFTIRIELLFRAERLRLVLENGEVIELESKDGYRWSGQLSAQSPGRLWLRPVADEEALEPTALEVVEREGKP